MAGCILRAYPAFHLPVKFVVARMYPSKFHARPALQFLAYTIGGRKSGSSARYLPLPLLSFSVILDLS